MSIRRYLRPVNSLPQPDGPLSSSLPPVAIKEANKSVEAVYSTQRKRKRGTYEKLTPEQQLAVAKYAALHGNQAAVRHFSKEFEIDVKESSVRTWKTEYLNLLSRMRMKGESPDQADIKCLPVKKGGKPLLLGEKLDTQVKSYLRAVCEGGGVVTTAITMAAATAIVRKGDRNLLSENGGPITITKNWAKSLLRRMNFVKRRGSSTAKIIECRILWQR